MSNTVIELFDNLGFKDHPFSTFTAEDEIDILDKMFSKPKFYSSIHSELKRGGTRFVFGERGSGKSALMYSLFSSLSGQNVFVSLIEDFDDIPLKNNKKVFLIKILRKLITEFSISMLNSKVQLRKLNKYDKEKLAFLIDVFFETVSYDEYLEIDNRVTKVRIKNLLKNGYNWFFSKIINISISSSVEVVSDLITKTLGLPKTQTEQFYKQYIPEFEIIKQKRQTISPLSFDETKLKNLLKELIMIVKKVGFENVVVFVDKIDENPKLSGKLDKIVDFTEQILRDNNLLLTQDLSLVFIIWSKIRIELNKKGVRLDKIKDVDITWSSEELRKVMDHRLQFFSKEEKAIRMSDLIKDEQTYQKLVEFSNRSPRDFIKLLSFIYDQQSMENSCSDHFEDKCIEKGLEQFIKRYDFYSLFPSTTSRKNDIYTIIDKILRIGKIEFENKDFVGTFKVSNNTAISHSGIMKDYNLITEIVNHKGNQKIYTLVDPKIKYLVEKGVQSVAWFDQ